MADSKRPEWWDRNSDLKRKLGIPEYEPPQFSDGKPTYPIIRELEDKFDCTVRFVGYDTQYPEDWTVEADEEEVMRIGRHRNENGNTVYKMASDDFKLRFRMFFGENND